MRRQYRLYRPVSSARPQRPLPLQWPRKVRPRSNVPFKPPAFALARLGARNCQGWRAADLFIGCGRRTTPLPNKGYSARGGPLSVLAAQQIEVIQPRACHLGLEFASRHNKQEIDGYSVQACLVIIGVDKGACAAPWHLFSCRSAGGRPPTHGLAQGSGADYADSGSRQGEPEIFCGRESSGGRCSVAEGVSPNSER